MKEQLTIIRVMFNLQIRLKIAFQRNLSIYEHLGNEFMQLRGQTLALLNNKGIRLECHPPEKCSRVIYRALFLLKGAPCLVTLCSRKFWAETESPSSGSLRAWARRTVESRFLPPSYPVVIAEMDLNLAATQALCGALCCHAASILIDLLYCTPHLLIYRQEPVYNV